jgi:hypothetical protein
MHKRDGSHDQMNPPTHKKIDEDDGIMILGSWKASCVVEELHTHK